MSNLVKSHRILPYQPDDAPDGIFWASIAVNTETARYHVLAAACKELSDQKRRPLFFAADVLEIEGREKFCFARDAGGLLYAHPDSRALQAVGAA